MIQGSTWKVADARTSIFDCISLFLLSPSTIIDQKMNIFCEWNYLLGIFLQSVSSLGFMTRPSFWSPPSVACCDSCRHSEDIGWNQTSLGNRDSINVAFLVTGDEDSPCSMALPKKVDSIVEPCQICLFGEILLWKIGENCQFKFQIMNQSADFDVFGSTTGGSAVIGENYLGGKNRNHTFSYSEEASLRSFEPV